MRTARDWNDFLRFALRRPESNLSEIEGGEVEGKTPMPSGTAPVFDWDAINAFNAQIPLSLWVDAARNPLLPTYMQLRIAEVGWFRAIILGKPAEARTLMERVGELEPGAAELTRGYLDAKEPETGGLAALYLILRSPALGPVLGAPHYRTPSLERPSYVNTDAYGVRLASWSFGQDAPAKPTVMDAAYLSSAQRAAGELEGKQIRAAEPWGASYLLRQTLAWADKYPEDPRLPEALHRAVMASRYRGADEKTGKLSKQAFVLLHQRYPKSEWSARTTYWFK